MTETQNIEYKKNWCDEHLKFISAFANSSGGKLLIENIKILIKSQGKQHRENYLI